MINFNIADLIKTIVIINRNKFTVGVTFKAETARDQIVSQHEENIIPVKILLHTTLFFRKIFTTLFPVYFKRKKTSASA